MNKTKSFPHVELWMDLAKFQDRQTKHIHRQIPSGLFQQYVFIVILPRMIHILIK